MVLTSHDIAALQRKLPKQVSQKFIDMYCKQKDIDKIVLDFSEHPDTLREQLLERYRKEEEQKEEQKIQIENKSQKVYPLLDDKEELKEPEIEESSSSSSELPTK